MDPCFHAVYTKFWPCCLNEIETQQMRQRFPDLLLSGFGESVWIIASVSRSLVTGVTPSCGLLLLQPISFNAEMIFVPWLWLLVISIAVSFLSSQTSVVTRLLFHSHSQFELKQLVHVYRVIYKYSQIEKRSLLNIAKHVSSYWWFYIEMHNETTKVNIFSYILQVIHS